MLKFEFLKNAVRKQFEMMSGHGLFVTDVPKDTLWEAYLVNFPPGTNPMFRERTEHDCQCCKQFIRACGNVIAIINSKKVSLWDVEVGGRYQPVVDALSLLVKSQNITNVFLHTERNLGMDKNRQLSDEGDLIRTWNHFHYELPNKFIAGGESKGTILSKKKSAKDVFKRGLSEITIDALNTVIELIDDKLLYRGDEHKNSVHNFLKHKIEFDKLNTEDYKDLFCWLKSVSIDGLSMFRNSVIGTLLVDLSEGMDTENAVRSFETKVAPQNYKRPTAIISKAMIAQAQKKVEELGITASLNRRFAVIDDVTVNNVLFVDRNFIKSENVFEQMSKEVPVKVDNLKKIQDISIKDFIKDILPKTRSIEVLFENAKENNLVSLIAPENIEDKPIFKWDNNFSWSYNGEVTDSIKTKVKKAGGNVTGVLRCSLAWFNYDDLDIHIIEPDGNHIYYQNKRIVHLSSGRLDVDMNVQDNGSRNAVENIVWTNKTKMQEGKYKLFINNYTPREMIDAGFTVEIEFDGEISTFNYNKRVIQDVIVAEFEFDRKSGIKLLKSIPSTETVREVWGLSTNTFHRVKMLINSPNHWNGNPQGNKHWFFILENCKNPKKARGFYNEYLRNDLLEHRKVFEVLAGKMKTELSNNQLSGLGFSSTQRNSLICKISGDISRMIKINF
jgi:hypothetical protein